MTWLVFALVVLYGLPMTGVWCFLWVGSRPRRGRFASWAVASLGSFLWLPLLGWVYAGVLMTTSPTQRRAARVKMNQDKWIAGIEAEVLR